MAPGGTTEHAARTTAVPRVLCVDDEPGVRRTLARTLRRAGFEADTAADAAQARERLRDGDYAVLLTDFRMPGEDGVALMASVGDVSDAVPVMLTGNADLGVALDAINRGHVHAFLEKPWTEEALVLTVRRAAERFALERALHDKVAELERANAALARRNAELERARDEVSRLSGLAATDDKTGVHSHRFFRQRLEEEVARAERYEVPLALVLIDLDGFKAVNERLGHVRADDALRAVADVLRSRIRIMDVLARFGGDEFVLLLPNTPLAGATALAERLRTSVAQSRLGAASPGEITLSIGLASMPEQPVRAPDDLVEAADRALYAAKDGGRNRCVVASAHP